MKTLGMFLIMVGLVMLVYTGFNFVTKERVMDLGPIKIEKEKEHSVQWSPIVGLALSIAGILIVISTKKKA